MKHISKVGDALLFGFVKDKTDQSSERPKDGKHVYANPIKSKMRNPAPAAVECYLCRLPPNESFGPKTDYQRW